MFWLTTLSEPECVHCTERPIHNRCAWQKRRNHLYNVEYLCLFRFYSVCGIDSSAYRRSINRIFKWFITSIWSCGLLYLLGSYIDIGHSYVFYRLPRWRKTKSIEIFGKRFDNIALHRSNNRLPRPTKPKFFIGSIQQLVQYKRNTLHVNIEWLLNASSAEFHANTTSVPDKSLLPFESLCQSCAHGKWIRSVAQKLVVCIPNTNDVERWLSYLSWSAKLCNYQPSAYKVTKMFRKCDDFHSGNCLLNVSMWHFVFIITK